MKTKLKKQKVVVEVFNGVASIKECPDNIEVEIIDLDETDYQESYVTMICTICGCDFKASSTRSKLCPDCIFDEAS